MANVGTVTFDLAAEAAKLRSELEKVRRDVSGLKKTGKDMGDALSGGFTFAARALGAFGVSLGGAAIIGGIARLTTAASEMADEIGKAATKAGIAASSMSELAYAARQNDLSLDTLSTTLRKMQETTSGAAAGNRAAAQTIESLGLSLASLRLQRPEQQFEAFADAIASIPDPSDRARLAVDVFGRTGADLLPMLARGASGVRMLREEARELGAAMSGEQLEKLQAMDDSVKKLTTSFRTLGMTLASSVAPAISSFMDDMRVALGAGTRMEELRYQIDYLKAHPEGIVAVGFKDIGTGVLTPREVQAEITRLERMVLDVQRRGARSLAETRGRRPFEASPAAAAAAGAGAASDTSVLDAWLASRGGAGSGMAGQAAGGRMVMRNGRLVSETEEQGAGLDAMGNEAALEAQRLMNERRVELERELTAQTVAEVGNRESLISELVAGSEAQQTAYRLAANMTWGEIISSGIAGAAAGNKRLAKIQQGYAIASAIWNTASGVTSALARYDFAGAAKIAAVGALQIAKIKSTSYSEGGGGSAPSVSGDAGGTVADRAGNAAPTQEVQAARPQATIIVQGNIMSTRESAEWFIEQVRDAVVDRDVVLIPSNSRQALELAGVGA